MQINNALYWILGVIALVITAGAWFFWPSATPATPSGSNSGNGFPQDQNYTPYQSGSTQGSNDATGASSDQQMTILMQNGQGIKVKDFIHNGETDKDVVNPGYYVMASNDGYCKANGDCVTGAISNEFSVSYHETDSSFNISLIKEPLGQARVDAEQFLLNRLGVEPAIMCTLNYYVSVPSSVNPVYAGKNLGFSFCPGAAQL